MKTYQITIAAILLVAVGFAAGFFTHRAMSAADYQAFVAKQITVWAPLIEAAGIKE